MPIQNNYANIDFMAPNKMALQKQQLAMQQIGQAMGQYNAEQNRDIQRRQLEIDANKPAAMKERDLQAVQAYQAGDRSPEIMNYLQGRQAMEGRKQQYTPDPLNPGSLRAVSVPNAFETMLGGAPPDPRTTIDGAPLADLTQPQMESELSGGGVSPPPSPQLVTEEAFAAAKAPQSPEFSNMVDQYALPPSPQYEGSLAQDIGSGEAAVGVKAHVSKYLAEKKINSIFEGQKLGAKSLAQQNKYEDSLKIMLDGYRGLIEEGAAIQTLSKDSDWGDVLKNLSAAASSTRVGQGIAGASGTRAQAARESMNRTLPLMFGSLRTLLGLTGKELDTPKEKAFYMKALPGAGVSIGSNLDNIEELSNRFGNSETASTVQAVRDLLNKGESKAGWSIKRK